MKATQLSLRRDRREFLALACASAMGVGVARAQSAYPERPLSMIVPFPPGGVADTVGRPLAEAMTRELKQPVVIENKGGAGGAVGITAAARAAPDGYTVLLSLSSMSVLPEADRVLGRKPSYQIEQFKPLARMTADPTVLVVRAESPWRTLEEFVADAKKRPGALNFGSSGNYGTMHIPMEMLKQAAGISMVHIPYTGAGPAITALLGGHVDALSTGPASVLQHIRAGKLRALAQWGPARLESLPEVPSLRERGFDVVYAQWSGVFVSAAVPQAVADRLLAGVRRVAADPAFRESILRVTGSPLAYQDADEFSRYLRDDVATMTDVVRRIGRIE
jgi:tripartite-type tricarboxylate transporter receptor subunit TctC